MALIKCDDCGREISQSAKNCIGCGKPIIANEKSETVVERKGGKFEMIGTLLILGSMGGCSVGMVASQMGGQWFVAGSIGSLIGIVVFLYGRFF